MKITLCGSIAFIDEMIKVHEQLEILGHEVKMPLREIMDDQGRIISAKEYYTIRKMVGANAAWVWKKKTEAMITHFDKVAWSDSILVLNYEKNGILGYVGANTLMEMGLALYLGKKIFLLNIVPELAYTEEILGMAPVVINGDLNKI